MTHTDGTQFHATTDSRGRQIIYVASTGAGVTKVALLSTMDPTSAAPARRMTRCAGGGWREAPLDPGGGDGGPLGLILWGDNHGDRLLLNEAAGLDADAAAAILAHAVDIVKP